MGEAVKDFSDSPGSAHLWITRIAAIMGIGGGATGLISSAMSWSSMGPPSAYFLWFVFLMLYVLGILAGIRVIEGRPQAVRDFRIYLWMQVPVLQTYVLTYFFTVFASYTPIYHGGTIVELGWLLGSTWTFAIFSMPSEFGVGINFVPLAVLGVLKLLTSRK